MAAFVEMLPVCAGVLAAAAGTLCGDGFFRMGQRRRLRQKALGVDGATAPNQVGKGGLYDRVIGFLIAATTRNVDAQEGGSSFSSWGAQRFAEKVQLAGLQGRISPAAYRSMRCRFGILLCAVGCVVGCVFSPILAGIGAIAGLFVGFMVPRMAIDHAIGERKDDLERELPQLLEVVALGLRSGLSFDRSFALYGSHFDTAFAAECARCQDQWSLGLKTREQALRDLANGYESVQLGRVVDLTIRALRFGTGLSSELEQAAAEARSLRQARRQEQVAKAPVKMMIPTGTLILPAMLLMVLGPVILQMAGGVL